jgi:hypothetical protein
MYTCTITYATPDFMGAVGTVMVAHTLEDMFWVLADGWEAEMRSGEVRVTLTKGMGAQYAPVGA